MAGRPDEGECRQSTLEAGVLPNVAAFALRQLQEDALEVRAGRLAADKDDVVMGDHHEWQ